MATVTETIWWEANVPDHGIVIHPFYLFSLYGINTNGTIAGFQINSGVYIIVNTSSMSRFDQTTTHNISQYDCLTIISEGYNTSTGQIIGIYDAWIQNSVA